MAERRQPPHHQPQGAQTPGKLEFEVTLRFHIRPAGWAGNDAGMFKRANSFLHKLLGLMGFVLLGDESVDSYTVRWRRHGEKWQKWSES